MHRSTVSQMYKFSSKRAVYILLRVQLVRATFEAIIYTAAARVYNNYNNDNNNRNML